MGGDFCTDLVTYAHEEIEKFQKHKFHAMHVHLFHLFNLPQLHDLRRSKYLLIQRISNRTLPGHIARDQLSNQRNRTFKQIKKQQQLTRKQPENNDKANYPIKPQKNKNSRNAVSCTSDVARPTLQASQTVSQPKPLPPTLLNERKLRRIILTPTRVRQTQQQQRNSNSNPAVYACRLTPDSGKCQLQRSSRSLQLHLGSLVFRRVDLCAQH